MAILENVKDSGQGDVSKQSIHIFYVNFRCQFVLVIWIISICIINFIWRCLPRRKMIARTRRKKSAKLMRRMCQSPRTLSLSHQSAKKCRMCVPPNPLQPCPSTQNLAVQLSPVTALKRYATIQRVTVSHRNWFHSMLCPLWCSLYRCETWFRELYL